MKMKKNNAKKENNQQGMLQLCFKTAGDYIKKNYNLKVIGICTDSPSNISGTTKIYTNKILDYSRNFDGFLALTNELGDLFNKKSKPQLIFEGIVEDKLPNPIVNEFGEFTPFGLVDALWASLEFRDSTSKI